MCAQCRYFTCREVSRAPVTSVVWKRSPSVLTSSVRLLVLGCMDGAVPTVLQTLITPECSEKIVETGRLVTNIFCHTPCGQTLTGALCVDFEYSTE